jgi:hypothetical protein
MSGEVHTDKILSLKDWIDSFWHFQEEDLNFFKNLLTRGKLPNVEEILKTLKERMQLRRAYYQIYKHLSWRDLPLTELEWVERKLTEILKREEIITEMIDKFLDFLTYLTNGCEGEEFISSHRPRILH